ncbi:zinc finger protein 646 isoform X2 [Oncorhynchus keta]|nr:zinc finger protein 646 isoform X2 [Oncorhynchus keta]
MYTPTMAMHDMSRVKGFPCKECDMVCPSTPSLLEHMKAHYQQEENGRFECEQCGRIYKHAGSLANHKKSHEVGSFQCPVCTRTLPNAVALKNHLRIHTLSPSSAQAEEDGGDEGAEDGHDERNYGLAQDLSDGFARSHLNNSGMGHGVMSHDPDDHKKSPVTDDAWDRPFKCDQCDRTYRHHGSLVNHKKCHQEGAFKCTVCYKQFNNLAALNGHERTHSKFKTPGASMVNNNIHDSVTDQRPSAPQTDDASNCFCHLCQVALPNKSDFQEHILLHNAASSSLGLARSFPGIMPHNLSAVRSPAYTPALGDPLPLPHLPNDKRGPFDPMLGPPVNNPIYTCAYCGAGHPDLESLKVHYLTHDPHPGSHGQDGILNTDGIGSNSNPSPSGERAQSSSDDGERRFKCQDCGKSYRHAGSLVNHKRSHQTGLYQCTICCKQYPHLAALHSHLRSHKGRTSNQSSLNTEGDWLSSEPLTLDSQNSYVQEGSGATTPISLPGNLGDAAHFVPDGGHSSGLDSLEFHDRFDGSLAQSNSGHSPLPQNHRQADRHMCTDCGEMYGDISGIKSHMCPQRRQNQGMSNGFMGNMSSYNSPGGAALPSGGGNVKESNGQRSQYGSQSHAQGGGKRMNKEDEDDGEVYQCSVCGNHYASLRALRSHLRSHANNPTGPGTSALSPNGEADWRIICSTCGQSFSRKQDLLNHQLIHGPQRSDAAAQSMGADPTNTNGKMDGDGRNHICVDCGMFFADRHHLITHLCPGKGRGGVLSKEGLNGAKGMTGGDGVSGGGVGGPGGSRDMGGQDRRQQMPDSEDRPHKCDQCGRGYRHPCSLLNHKKSHKTGVFRCLVCQKRYYNLLALKNHQRTHFDLKRHKCEECGKAFKIQKQLENHLRLHEEHRAKAHAQLAKLGNGRYQGGPSGMQAMRGESSKSQNPGMGEVKYGQQQQGFKQPYSEAGTSRAQNFDLQEGGRRPFACDECGRSYRHAGSLANHKNLHKIGEYHCNVCNSTYPNRLAMKNHLRLHFALKKHTCQECGKGFRTQKQLTTHHSAQLCKGAAGAVAQMDYECDGCCEGFATADELAAHDCPAQQLPSSSASLNSSSLSIDGADLVPDERPYSCDICNCSYKHASSLLNHKHTHKTGTFTCTYCDKPYSNYMALRNHMRIHTQKKRHICHHCGKAFRLARFLRNHQKVHEEGHTRFGCTSCGKSFQGRSGLARHRCGENQVGKEGRRMATASTTGGEECRYTCDQCGRSYAHASSLLNHKNTHTVGIYHCAVCLKTYSNLLALKNHRRIHSEIRRHRCPECGKAFRVSSQLNSHRRVHLKERELTCGPCQRSFPSQASFRLHQEISHGQAPRPPQQTQARAGGASGGTSGGGSSGLNWGSGLDLTLLQAQGLDPNGLPKMNSLSFQGPSGSRSRGATGTKSHICNQCGRTYLHASSLLNHKNSHKTGAYFCNSCQKEFPNLMSLKNHRRIHTEPKRFQCPDCGKSFRVSTQLICHRRIHTKEKPFSCQQCNKRFSSKSNLRHHQKVHWSSSAPPTMAMGAASFLGHPPIAAGRPPKSHVCDQCGRGYRHAGSLQNHKNIHKTGAYFCSSCQKEFSNLMALKTHRRIHTEVKRHRCSDCGKAFRAPSQLIVHRRIHTQEKPFSCQQCTKRFSSKSNLRHHMKLHWSGSAPSSFLGKPVIGGGAKSHVCDQCGRAYRHASSLLNHKTIHKTGAYFCTSCQKEFHNLNALKNHQRIHTETKRYECPECGKSFRVSTQLIIHRRIHTKEKPFSCQQCDKRFSSKSNLRHHMKLHWGSSARPVRTNVSVAATSATLLALPQTHISTKYGWGWGKGKH